MHVHHRMLAAFTTETEGDVSRSVMLVHAHSVVAAHVMICEQGRWRFVNGAHGHTTPQKRGDAARADAGATASTKHEGEEGAPVPPRSVYVAFSKPHESRTTLCKVSTSLQPTLSTVRPRISAAVFGDSAAMMAAVSPLRTGMRG